MAATISLQCLAAPNKQGNGDAAGAEGFEVSQQCVMWWWFCNCLLIYNYKVFCVCTFRVCLHPHCLVCVCVCSYYSSCGVCQISRFSLFALCCTAWGKVTYWPGNKAIFFPEKRFEKQYWVTICPRTRHTCNKISKWCIMGCLSFCTSELWVFIFYYNGIGFLCAALVQFCSLHVMVAVLVSFSQIE